MRKGNKNERNMEEGNMNIFVLVLYKGYCKKIPIDVMDLQIIDILERISK
jgi:hypothetical protein